MKHDSSVWATLLLKAGIATSALAAGTNDVATSSSSTNGPMRVLVLADPIYQTYRTESTASYSHIAVNPMDLPATVNQVTPKLVSDLGARQLKDVVDYVPSVHQYSDQGHVLNFCKFFIRGFEQTYSWRDGMRNYGGNVIDIDALESVDVVKGPNSAQAGLAEVGGYMNYVTKGASLQDTGYRNQLTSSTTDTGRYSVRAESGGKVMDNLATYVAAGYSDGHTYRDVNKQVLTANLGLQGKVTEDDLVDLRFAYTHERRDMDFGVLLDNGHRIGSIHKNWTEGTSNDGLTMDDIYLVGTWTHTFSDDLKTHTRVNVHEFQDSMDCFRFPSYNSKTKTLTARYDGSDLSLWELQLGQDVEWHYEMTEWLENTAVAGVDLSYRQYVWHRDWVNGYTRTIYNNQWYAPAKITHLAGSAQHTDMETVSPYWQDEIRLVDDLHFMGGLRGDFVHQWNRAAGANSYTRYHDNALSGNIGVMYDVFDWLHPYFSYSTSFVPNGTQTTASGARLDPERGEQFEAGIKMPFFDDTLRFGACGYWINKENVARAVTDPASGKATGYYEQDGEVRSRGIELTAEGEAGKYVELTAAYTYIDAEYVKSSTFRKGARMLGIPHNNASFWGVWHAEGVRSPYGFRAGGGVVAMGSRPESIDGKFSLGSYCTLNLVCGYGWEYMKGKLADIQLNLFNVTDTDYYQSSQMSTVAGSYPASAMPGQPFGGMITIKFTF